MQPLSSEEPLGAEEHKQGRDSAVLSGQVTMALTKQTCAALIPQTESCIVRVNSI